MCVILYSPKGIDIPKKNTFLNMWKANHDGAGFAYADGEKVIVRKGFMTFEDFWKAFTSTKKSVGGFTDKNLVCHFRIGTSGKNNAETCHPYPISAKKSELKATSYETDIAVAHNGIIQGYGRLDAGMNDTQSFIKRVLVPLSKAVGDGWIQNKQVKALIEQISIINAVYNRFCFLQGQGEAVLIGDWKQKDGNYYSNLNHEVKAAKKTKKKNAPTPTVVEEKPIQTYEQVSLFEDEEEDPWDMDAERFYEKYRDYVVDLMPGERVYGENGEVYSYQPDDRISKIGILDGCEIVEIDDWMHQMWALDIVA